MSAGGITGWLSTSVAWVNQFGAFGWWSAALAGCLIASLILLALAWLRYAWRKGAAIEKWKETVDGINPLDEEFSKKRIKISDLVDPAQSVIKNKMFIGCDLVGPTNIAFLERCNISYVGFINCDIIPVKDNVYIRNAVGLVNVTMTKGRIINATILVPPNMISVFTALDAPLIGFTKDEVQSVQSPQDIAEETPP